MRDKKSVLFILLCFLFILSACEASNRSQRTYQHINFTSTIEKEDCYLCGDSTDNELALYWGQDNLGLVNMNTFEVMRVEINTYDMYGAQLEEERGVYLTGSSYLGESLIHVFTDPDRGYSHITVYNEERTIDPEAIGTFLCQDCLDALQAAILKMKYRRKSRW